MPDRWIVIENWDGFQHYKDRTPKWIKTYVELMTDDAYLGLTGHQRGVLHGLWLEYASARCQLALDTGSLTRRLGLRVSSATLEALNHAGFIQFSASKPLAKPEHPASPDKRREETPISPSGKPPTKSRNGHAHVCGIGNCKVTYTTEARILEHREYVHAVMPATVTVDPYLDELAATVDLDQQAGTLDQETP